MSARSVVSTKTGLWETEAIDEVGRSAVDEAWLLLVVLSGGEPVGVNVLLLMMLSFVDVLFEKKIVVGKVVFAERKTNCI